MNFTTKSRYAVNALADLEYLSHYETPVSLKDIAHRQDVRGRNGGYVYASHPQKVSIKNIMEAVEENLDATNCSGTSSCHAGQQCNSHKLWDDLNNVVDNRSCRKAKRSPYTSKGN